MRIIGHHTCSNTGNFEGIETAGPFLSVHDEDDELQHKFLGTGYYFWDNNLGMAHAHGQKHYRRRYCIFEAELELSSANFLDLVGNRIDMMWLEEVMKKLEPLQKEGKPWTMGSFIELLKELNQTNEFKGIFPYKAIRSVDNSIDPKEVHKFVSRHRAFTNLNPILIVCLLDLDAEILRSFRLAKIFPPPNV